MKPNTRLLSITTTSAAIPAGPAIASPHTSRDDAITAGTLEFADLRGGVLSLLPIATKP